MKGLVVLLIVLMTFSLAPAVASGLSDQAGSNSPPISQPLVREGTVAVKLAEVLKIGTTTNEAEAESLLAAAGVAPRNGWVADYPVTPDIVGELQTAVAAAAEAQRISMAKDDALTAFQGAMGEYSLTVRPDTQGNTGDNTAEAIPPDPAVINNYYYDEGPPVVTYYAPPPDYAYLYTWVGYPFWWWDAWFPGFFVLVDFDVHHHRHHFTNHVFDHNRNRFFSIDPAKRAHGGTFAGNDRPRAFRASGTQAMQSRGFAGSITATGSPASDNRRWAGPSAAGSVHSPGVQGGSPATLRYRGTMPVQPSGGTYKAAPFRGSGMTGSAVGGTLASPRYAGGASGPQFSGGSYRYAGGGHSHAAYSPAGSYSPPAARSFSAPSGGYRSFSAPSGGGAMVHSFTPGSFGGGGRSFRR